MAKTTFLVSKLIQCIFEEFWSADMVEPNVIKHRWFGQCTSDKYETFQVKLTDDEADKIVLV
jgi:predicted nucleic-acid-binding Zn-ribbon protein